MTESKISIFWHRRDLRLEDNAGAFHALSSGLPVVSLFIFDRNILERLEDKDDPRVDFIHQNILRLKSELEDLGSSIVVKYGYPEKIWEDLSQTYNIGAVYTNHDYEPYGIQRDQKIKELLETKAIPFHSFKDQVIFERLEVAKKDGKPYTVFTPYSKQWKHKLLANETSTEIELQESSFLKAYQNEALFSKYAQIASTKIPSLTEMGFTDSGFPFPDQTVSQGLIRKYQEQRDFPAIQGTSRLGIHFRFGTISIRAKARSAIQLSPVYLSELIWRDFYAQILANFPRVAKHAFRPKYEFIQWRNKEEEFKAWCDGQTGYPIVDAGMRELNATGFMHNRVRMITASFLTKHLLIDWRWGEAYFARKLLDFDLASNNGGWQWAAGTGTDAAPYFRIFNPYSQQEKFDKEWKYIQHWVPEVNTPKYPEPIVEHKFARERCLAAYKTGLDRAAE